MTFLNLYDIFLGQLNPCLSSLTIKSRDFLIDQNKKYMKKILTFGEEIIPLSRQQYIVLLVIITCVFQFVLFHSPVLAEEAMQKNSSLSEEMIFASTLTKDVLIDKEAAKFSSPVLAREEVEELRREVKERVIAQATSSPIVKVIRTSVHSMTAYNSEAAQTDDSPCITANGFNVCEHGIEDTVAANFLPMGTKIRIPELFGDRIFIVRDRMNKRYTERVDVWMLSRADALQFGVRKAKIEVVEVIEPNLIVMK